MNIFVVNLAILVHSFLGLVVVGWFPSVAAAYGTWRHWFRESAPQWTARETWATFHHLWRGELGAANLLGWPLTLAGALLVLELRLMTHEVAGASGAATGGALTVILFALVLFAMLVWVVRAHFDQTSWWAARTTVQMLLARPICSLMLAVLGLITLWTWSQWPGLLVVFGAALPIFLVTAIVYYLGGLPGFGAPRPSRVTPHHPKESS
ncbi:YesL family protein [Promicromonospora sp. AC04]|uniref:YesL family protein n=1 Tax=Promicromonospora sp. AC04 TaxID=2135723 RepID=UPI0011B298E3|nr:DUF624 domain-containing protein [Promicromonospora sp. AC04]